MDAEGSCMAEDFQDIGAVRHRSGGQTIFTLVAKPAGLLSMLYIDLKPGGALRNP